MERGKPSRPQGNSTDRNLSAKEGHSLGQTFPAQSGNQPKGQIHAFNKAAHAPSLPKASYSHGKTPGGMGFPSKDASLKKAATTSNAGSQAASRPARDNSTKSAKRLPTSKGSPAACATHEAPPANEATPEKQPHTSVKGPPSSSPGMPRAPLPPDKLSANHKDLQRPRSRLDGIAPEPLPTTPYEDPALNSMLLGKWKVPEQKPKPNLIRNPTINLPQLRPAARAAATREDTATGEAELGLAEDELLTADDRLRVNRLSTKEAMGTFLVERAADESWDHRQKLHSELRSNPAYTVEVGTDWVGGKLAADVHAVRRGVLRVEALDEDINPDPYGPHASAEAPLPHTIGLGSKEAELVALSAIGKTAHTMKERLVDRFPYLDISWSRQPSFDEANFDDLFGMEPEATYAEFPITEDFLHSHDRIRLAAARISQCVENKDVTCREVVRLADDINAMYESVDSCEAFDNRVTPWQPDLGFLANPSPEEPVTSPSSKEHRKQGQVLNDPAEIAELWDKRNVRYHEIEDEEEKDRMALLNEIVHEIYQQFGGEWSNRLELLEAEAYMHCMFDTFLFVQLPKTSVLVKLLREPQPAALREEVPNPQSIILNYIMEPNEVTELVHSLLVPLIMERFYLFDMRFAETPSLLLEEAANVMEWCLASRALSRMSRIANYILTDRNLMDKSREYSAVHDRNCSNFMLVPEITANDQAVLLRRARLQLNTLLQNSTSCSALRFNVEAISKLMPFMTEYTANMPKKETICDRLFDSFLTQAFFWAIGDHAGFLPIVPVYLQIPDSPQAVSLVTSYIEMLTETLYAMRSADRMQRINHARHPVDLGLWQNLRRGFHPKLNIFLCRTILCFVADLMYMTCLDGAPLLLSLCREMHQVLQDVVVPTLRDKRPDLATDLTWGYCWRTAVCLRDVFQKAGKSEAINSSTLLPYTLVSRCGLRGGGPWPSLWQSVWEPKYHEWRSGSEQLKKRPSFAETKHKSASAPFVNEQEREDRKSGGGAHQDKVTFHQSPEAKPSDLAAASQGKQDGTRTVASRVGSEGRLPSRRGESDPQSVPPHRLWKGSVIPCWLPGCKTILHQAADMQPSGVKMHYCPKCYIASYCSVRCRKLHHAQGHAQVGFP
ncbi:hypothetical protein Emag_005362 [Eimeria magna]